MPPSVRTTASLSLLAILLLATTCFAHSVARNPLLRISSLENPTIQTTNHKIHAFSHFDLLFDVFDHRLRLSLEPNHDVIAPGAKVTFLDANGLPERVEAIDRTAHKVFKGVVLVQDEGHDNRWTRVGDARISVYRDGARPLFVGKYDMFGDHHHIHLASEYVKTRTVQDPDLDFDAGTDDDYMVMWKDSDISTMRTLHTELKRSVADVQCRGDELSFNARPDHPVYLGMKAKRDELSWTSPLDGRLGRRQIDGIPGSGNSGGVNLTTTIGKTDGCPSTRKVALVGVATDCTYTGTFNSENATRSHIIDVMNSASSLYERTFNISLGLQHVTVSPANCPGSPQQATPWNVPCSDSVNLQDRLNLFSAWRGNQQDNNSHWTLLTNCPTDSAIGLAWLGQACVQDAQTMGGSGGNETVSGANVVAKTDQEWAVIAHETGHTFGAVHDCTSQTCSDGTVKSQQCCPLSSSSCDAQGRYIMNPSSAEGISDFSPCSIGNICAAFDRNSVDSQCFSENKNVPLFTGKQCGNGIVEEGEDCDCGGEAGCGDNSCCDATTCKFKGDAVCDDSNEDCCRECQFAASGVVCRASTGSCDPEETCTGSGPNCPADVTKPNGSGCGGGLSCASGQCTSRDQQCKTVMGSYTTGNDTYACDRYGCSISCASPEFGTGTCYGLNQNFLDGTSCGGGGRCSNGQCKGSSVGGEIKSWVDDHKGLVIGLAAGIGGLVVLLLLSCLWRCCRRRSTRKAYAKTAPAYARGANAPMAAVPWGSGGGGGGVAAAARMSRSRTDMSMMGADHLSARSPGPAPGGWDGPVPPQQPRPTYVRTQSVRYA